MMPSFLQRRCIVALLFALWSACIYALSGWGTIEIPLNRAYPFVQNIQKIPTFNNHQLFFEAIFFEPLILVGIGTLALMLWGQWLFFYKRRKTDTPWPWRALLINIFLHSTWWVMQTLSIANYPAWYQHLIQAGIGFFLFLGIMSEKIDNQWGQGRVVVLFAIIFIICAIWFLMFCDSSYKLDARIFIAIQILPLLFILTDFLIFYNRNYISFYNRFVFVCVIYGFSMVATWLPNIFDPNEMKIDEKLWWYVLPWFALMFLWLLLIVTIDLVLQRQKYDQKSDTVVNKFTQISFLRIRLLSAVTRQSSS